MLHQLIYYSRFTTGEGGTLNTVRDILRTSQDNNYRDNITGFLVFDKSHFLQILEGELALVNATYARIGKDSRHNGLWLIETRPIEARAFPDWAMGGFIRSADVQDIYVRHGLAGDMQPERLKADHVVALARDLLTFEQTRQGERVIDIMSR